MELWTLLHPCRFNMLITDNCRFCRFSNSWSGKGTVTRISGQFKSQERRLYPLVCWHQSEPVSPPRQTCGTKKIYKESNVKAAVERTQVQRLSCAVVVAAVAWSSCAFRFVMFACVVLCFFFSISGHVCWWCMCHYSHYRFGTHPAL